MRTLVHLSDLHFGKIDSAITSALTRDILRLKPNVLVVSGDLTQRARTYQFEQARSFLDQFSCAKLVVPGNHDVPLYNVLRRFWKPLTRYRRYISDDIQTFYEDELICMVGLSTVRSFTIQDGKFEEPHLNYAKAKFSTSNKIKIVVSHHPLDLQATEKSGRIFAKGLLELNPDILMAGHYHANSSQLSSKTYLVAHRSAVLLQAGTATSTRTRDGHANAFNLVHLEKNNLEVIPHLWEASTKTFVSDKPAKYFLSSSGWSSGDEAMSHK